jgi:pre-mRNA-splicing helicase BRR2
MAQNPNNLAQFKYAAMSNLVLQADRRFTSRRPDDLTGDPESLAGRINIRDMGGRTAQEKAPTQAKKPKLGVERGSLTEGGDVLDREQRKRKRDDGTSAFGATATADFNIEGLRYRPRTPATRNTFELLTTIVSKALGDVPVTTLRSAADAVLEYLKDDTMKDFDKKKEVDDLLGSSMGAKEFNELVNLGKKITDYDAQDDEDGDQAMADADGAENDDNQGVAVVFDDEEDEEAQNFEVRDADTSDEEEEQETAIEEIGIDKEEADGGFADTEEMVVQDESAATGRKDADQLIPAHEIDAFWLQRQVGQVYEDAHTQQEKTRDALQILAGIAEDGEERELREIENDLMELFDNTMETCSRR